MNRDNYHADEIAKAIATHAISATEIPTEECENLIAVLESFTSPGDSECWDRFDGEQFVVHDTRSWTRIPEFVEGPTIALVDDRPTGVCGFRFGSPENIVDALGDCFRFEFYLTNDTQSYWLAFNHHDVTIAIGDVLPQIQAVYQNDG